MSRKCQKNQNQLELALEAAPASEAQGTEQQGTELHMAKWETESAAGMYGLLEEILERDNLRDAWKRVKGNQGCAGVDGMTVDELKAHLDKHWPAIREQMQSGNYQPQPVKREEIKKEGGGMRNLGIPTVVDRFLQQAVAQVLQRKWDGTFSEHSYGFRPGRSAQQAVAQAQQYIAAGFTWCVDLDLEKFFDRVNHDKLMGQIAKRVEDKRVLKLIRAMLKAGVVMKDGLVSPSEEGTPQGGPLSPLLSNLVLDELDRELERRGHRFVRYADDCNIYVRSERAGQRVMESVKQFISKKLKLKVNETKSAVAKPQKRKFLGFSFTGGKEPKRRIAPQAIHRFKREVRRITRRIRGISMEQRVKELASYLRGWLGYFGHCQTPTVLENLNSWIRRRIRCVFWQQWKTSRKRHAELIKRGVKPDLAADAAGTRRGPWRISRSQALSVALPNDYLHSLGIPRLVVR